MADANNMREKESVAGGIATENLRTAEAAADNMTVGDERNKAAAEKSGNNRGRSFSLRIITPEKTLFDGMADSVIIKTQEGYEGFLRGRARCCKLMAADGSVKICESGTQNAGFRLCRTKGGFADMDGRLLIYADEAEWDEE